MNFVVNKKFTFSAALLALGLPMAFNAQAYQTVATLCQNADFGGYNVSLEEGEYTMTQLNAKGVKNNDISSLKVTPGFKVILYKDDNFSGETKEVTSDLDNVGDAWNDQATSLKIVPDGVAGLNGKVCRFKNANSGYYLNSAGNESVSGKKIVQSTDSYNLSQNWYLQEVSGLKGVYNICADQDHKLVFDCEWANEENGTKIQIIGIGSGDHRPQQFIIYQKEEGKYQLVSRSAGRVIDVPSSSKEDGIEVQLYDNNGTNAQVWTMENPKELYLVGESTGWDVGNGMKFTHQGGGVFTCTIEAGNYGLVNKPFRFYTEKGNWNSAVSLIQDEKDVDVAFASDGSDNGYVYSSTLITEGKPQGKYKFVGWPSAQAVTLTVDLPNHSFQAVPEKKSDLTKGVTLSGSFNNWERNSNSPNASDPTYKLEKADDGKYKGTFSFTAQDLQFRLYIETEGTADWGVGSYGPCMTDHTCQSVDLAHTSSITSNLVNGLGNFLIAGFKGGELSFEYDPAKGTLKVTGKDVKIEYAEPEHLYIIGDIEGVEWNTNSSIELTKVGNKYVAKNVKFAPTGSNEYAYFYFNTIKAESWDDVKWGDCYGAAIDPTKVDPYVAGGLNLFPGKDTNSPSHWTNSFITTAGSYDVVVDMAARTVTLMKSINNSTLSDLPKVGKGQWTYYDNADESTKWAEEGKADDVKYWHDYPQAYVLDWSGVNAEPGEVHKLSELAPLLGEGGLLEDENRSNLFNVATSPYTASGNLVYEADGVNPVTAELMFSSATYGSRLCYFYVPAGDTRDMLQLCKDLSQHRLPSFSLTNEMRASQHLTRIDSENKTHTIGNSELGKNFAQWLDQSIQGKKFTLKYFGDNYDAAASDRFPEGTKIYFYLATTSYDGSLNADSQTNFLGFSSRDLNKEFGTAGNWNVAGSARHKELNDMFGEGILSSVAIDYNGLNLLAFEDYPASDVFDMNDAVFALSGVKKLETSDYNLPEIKVNVTRKSTYDAAGDKNVYDHEINVSTLEDGIYLRSNHLKDVTKNEDGTFCGSVTPIYIYRKHNDAAGTTWVKGNDEAERTIFLRKEATLNGSNVASSLINRDIEYKVYYLVATDQNNVPALDESWTLLQTYKRGDFDSEVIDLSRIKVVDHHECGITVATAPVRETYWAKISGVNHDGKDLEQTSAEVSVDIPAGNVSFTPAGMATAEDEVAKIKHLNTADDLSIIANGYYVDLTASGNVTSVDNFQLLNGKGTFAYGKALSDKDVNDASASAEGKNRYWFKAPEADLAGSSKAQIATPDNCTFGVVAASIPAMPTVNLTIEKVEPTGVAYIAPTGYSWITTTQWSYENLPANVDISDLIAHTSQWRTYDNRYKFDASDTFNGDYVHVLSNQHNMSPLIPEGFYLRMIQGKFGLENNEAHVADQGRKLEHHDVLYQGAVENAQADRKVKGTYIVRTYIPAYAPATNGAMRAADTPTPESYIVVDSSANFDGTGKANLNETLTGIENVTFGDDTKPVYYNMQGVRVESPVDGQLYIVIRGGKATKEIVK